jgi:HEAT repeat protein
MSPIAGGGRESVPSRASDAFTAWVHETVAQIAQQNGLTGKGPVFRKHEGEVWTVFAVERRRMDPREAAQAADDPRVEFRMNVGLSIPAIRPAWDTRTGPPGMQDMTVRSPSLVLEPADGEFWHVFDVEEPDGQARLAEMIRVGLPEALAALEPSDARSVLGRKLQHVGPLENLSPFEAEELLALADLVGDAEIRMEITEALKRPRVPQESDRVVQEMIEASADIFGPGIQVIVLRPPADEVIKPPMPAMRRSPKIRSRLLEELDSERPEVRRFAAAALGGWDGDADVVDALRAALQNADGYTKASAARSLGHLGDADAATWVRSLDIAKEASEEPREIAEAIVLLARLDLDARREEGARTVSGMCVRYPAETRKLVALAGLLA